MSKVVRWRGLSSVHLNSYQHAIYPIAKPCCSTAGTLPPITWWSQPAPSTVTCLRSCIPCIGVGQKKIVLHIVLSKLSYTNTKFRFSFTWSKTKWWISVRKDDWNDSLCCAIASDEAEGRSFVTSASHKLWLRVELDQLLTFGSEERKERNNQLDHSASEADVSSSSSF